jgi:hypothetical protein
LNFELQSVKNVALFPKRDWQQFTDSQEREDKQSEKENKRKSTTIGLYWK